MIEHMPERCPLCGAPVSESRFAELQAHIHEEERRTLEATMAAAREELQRKHHEELEAQAAAFREQAAQASRALAESKQAEAKSASAEAELRHREELTQQRSALEKDGEDRLRKLNEQRVSEQQKWQTRLADLQRQVEKKTADELGNWPEVDLFQSLSEEFKDDRVTRVAKGEEGADIIVEVMQRGRSCGKIVIDSKNRKAWRDSYVEKLRKDRDAAKADHAVLATSVFPSGAKDICIREGAVVVVRPHGVITIVRIMRASLVGNHIRELGAEQREAKAAKLYEYMNSADFRQTLGAALTACEELEDLDVDEKRAHDKMWLKRGSLQREIARALGNVETKVTEIVEVRAISKPRIA